MLTKEQRKRLLKIARKSIEDYLGKNRKIKPDERDPLLLSASGVFVTLHKDGDLRGCIGRLSADKPLYLGVCEMAVEAAVGDPRFAPVNLEELEKIEIEISVLSPMTRVYSADEIKLGAHGVLVKQGFSSGVFLPQVAGEAGWSKEEFLSQLCSHKAGLEPDAWKDKTTELYIFTAEIFSERNY